MAFDNDQVAQKQALKQLALDKQIALEAIQSGNDESQDSGTPNYSQPGLDSAAVAGALNSPFTMVDTNDFPELRGDTRYHHVSIDGHDYVSLKSTDGPLAGLTFDDPPGTGLSRDQIFQRISKVGLADQQCVTLAEAGVGIHKDSRALGSHVSDWRPGSYVLDKDHPLLPGTPIATFLTSHHQESAIYADGTGGRMHADLDHAAIFQSYVRDKNGNVIGFNVLEQYAGSGGVHQHTYLANGTGGEHDARMYHAIMDTRGEFLGGINNPMSVATATVTAQVQKDVPHEASPAPTNGAAVLKATFGVPDHVASNDVKAKPAIDAPAPSAVPKPAIVAAM